MIDRLVRSLRETRTNPPQVLLLDRQWRMNTLVFFELSEYCSPSQSGDNGLGEPVRSRSEDVVLRSVRGAVGR